MTLAANVLVIAVAVIHVYIMWLEMFAWMTPYGRRVFGTTEQLARDLKVAAANQGLYNGFLAAGLFWGVIAGSDAAKIFFLVCVAIAGIYGGATVNRRILYVQTVPALAALVAVLVAR